MKTIFRKLSLAIVTIFMGGFLTAAPVFAECPEGCVPVSIIGNATGTNGENCNCPTGSNGEAGGIEGTLKLVVNIMSVGVGILAAIGIAVVGIQYITAGGNEEQTRKAKRRMFEIVIGVLAYVLLYALLSWLLPGFRS